MFQMQAVAGVGAGAEGILSVQAIQIVVARNLYVTLMWEAIIIRSVLSVHPIATVNNHLTDVILVDFANRVEIAEKLVAN